MRKLWKSLLRAPATAASGHQDLQTVTSSAQLRWKRSLVLAALGVGFPVWLPAMVLTALWIKCVSRGPVFYRQERIGRSGRPFMMYKFRSMNVDADVAPHVSHVTTLIHSNSPMTKLDHSGDRRLIRGGRLLRALGMDELPQIFNVWRGEMSLVGPRPCTPYEFAHYAAAHLPRVQVAPGLTGYWQVNGKNRTTFSEMIEMDVFYARNLSLRLDLHILARTGPVLLQELLGRPSHSRPNIEEIPRAANPARARLPRARPPRLVSSANAA
ncbi:MAG TPA: sugar transferase [Chthoniobacterales bacterium]|nr:sugar transferase [Chthoniobacterales bacterium]